MMDREIVAEGSVKELTKERIEEVYHVAVELLSSGREQPCNTHGTS